MDKRLGLTLLIEGAVGILATAGLYLWGKTIPPCQEMECLVDFPHASYIFGVFITIFVLMFTLLVSGIGHIIRKDSGTKSKRFLNITVVLMILAIFIYVFLRSRILI